MVSPGPRVANGDSADSPVPFSYRPKTPTLPAAMTKKQSPSSSWRMKISPAGTTTSWTIAQTCPSSGSVSVAKSGQARSRWARWR